MFQHDEAFKTQLKCTVKQQLTVALLSINEQLKMSGAVGVVLNLWWVAIFSFQGKTKVVKPINVATGQVTVESLVLINHLQIH